MMKFEDIRVGTELKFRDITDEVMRSYCFVDLVIVIQNPVALRVSDSGGHYIIDSEGLSHYIPTGWRELMWESREGKDHVRF